MNSPITCVLIAAIVLTACARPPTDTSADEAELALDLITQERLEAHVAYLADDARRGRRPGEPGYDDAAAYVAEQMAAMGVSAGGSDGWYQQVTLRRYKLDTEKAAMSIHRDTEDIALTYRDEFAMSADEVRVESSVRGQVAYVGFGVHAPEFGYSDYDGIDVSGKIIALFRGAPDIIEGSARAYHASSRVKVREAIARGAIGALTLRSRKAEERRTWEKSKPRFGRRASMTWINDAGEAANYHPELRAFGFLSIPTAERLFGVSPLSFEEAHAASLNSTQASALLTAEVSMHVGSTHSTISSPNVVGVVRGTDPELADEYVVYTAHLDHLGARDEDDGEDAIDNGLYDNAMGVALMLETARVIAAAPPKRSVMFIALTAEESGLLGSDFFVNNPTVPVDALVANINLDMPLFLYPLADLVAFGSQHSSLQGVVKASARQEGFELSPDPMPEENLFIRSDQYSFVRQGVPAIFLVSGFASSDEEVDGEALFRDHLNNHYHEPSDDLSRPIDWPSAVRFARAHTRMGFIVASARERPSWNEGDFFGERFGRQ